MTTSGVKFFNPNKGFGFIQPDDGGADIFVHKSTVEHSGLCVLSEADQVGFDLEQDSRTGKMSAVDPQVTDSSPPHSRSLAEGRRSGPISGSGDGVVKLFNPAKGFGFILFSGGGGDVFVHVQQAGLRELYDGQPVSYDLEHDQWSTQQLSSHDDC
jgi:CspA family cold shock protein